MKKIYVTLLLLLLCTASVFSSQLYNSEHGKAGKSVVSQKDSTTIISNIVALPSFK